jgi:hypothetical protein
LAKGKVVCSPPCLRALIVFPRAGVVFLTV